MGCKRDSHQPPLQLPDRNRNTQIWAQIQLNWRLNEKKTKNVLWWWTNHDKLLLRSGWTWWRGRGFIYNNKRHLSVNYLSHNNPKMNNYDKLWWGRGFTYIWWWCSQQKTLICELSQAALFPPYPDDASYQWNGSQWGSQPHSTMHYTILCNVLHAYMHANIIYENACIHSHKHRLVTVRHKASTPFLGHFCILYNIYIYVI